MAAPEDLVSEVELGESLMSGDVKITVELDGTVTKGQLGALADGETWPPHADGAGAGIFDGVFLKAGDDGDFVPLLKFGLVKVLAGGIVAAGDPVASDTNGKAIAATTGVGGGQAMMSAGEEDDEFIIFVGIQCTI
ncbi:MAG: DUF2190 family protein [Desulfobacterales bacterium]|nr:DUF2190 family protein [Desulfobacterales bacterium]